MPDHHKSNKPSSVVKSIISKQLTKIASSTTANSNSAADENTPPPGYVAKVATATIIDDVPLNKKVQIEEKKSTRNANKSRNTTVVGSKDLKLKVSHNEAGRVVISVSNPEKILVQVHVDESVFKKKTRSSNTSHSGSSSSILKKKKKSSSSGKPSSTTKVSSSKKEDKDRPKKKSSTLTKQKSKKVLPSTSSSSGTRKMSNSSSSINKRRGNEPRDLPDEQSSTRGRDRTSSTANNIKSRSSSMERTKKLLKPATKNFTAHFSSMMSVVSGLSREGGEVVSHCGSDSSDDSTRSPLDLNRCNTAPPKTPAALTETEMIMMENDFASVASTAVPTWDRRRQMMKLKGQNSKLMDEPTPHLHDDLRSHHRDGSTEAKTEETAHPQPEEDDDDEDLSVFSSPLQQRRLQHRQKRLEKQKAEGEEIFRSTRSIRTAHSNISNPMAPLPGGPVVPPTAPATNTRPLDPPSMELDASANTTTLPAPGQLIPEPSQASMATGSSKSSGNRARHTRTSHQIPHEDDDDDESATRRKGQQQQRRTSSMIRQTIENVRKVEMVNKGDKFSGRSSYRNKDSDADAEKATVSKTGSNLFTKIRDKVSSTSTSHNKKKKRQKKEPKVQQQQQEPLSD